MSKATDSKTEDQASDGDPEAKPVEVTLARAHTHAGVDYAEGDKLAVRPDQKTWLEEQGIVDKPGAKPKAKDKSE